MPIKLPKQWLHWVRLAGLKTEGNPRERYSKFYLKGKNRNWRVDCHGEMECSCPLEHFDRWANSRGASIETIPQTKNEFLIAVKNLIDQSKDTK